MRGLLACVLCCVFLAGTARAGESVRTVPYAIDKVWPAALRLLRVDLKVNITERDKEAGYVLFEVVDDKKVWKGSMQLAVATDADGREGTRVQITIEDRPSYVADTLIDRFKDKLKGELGDPPPAPPRPSKKKNPPAEGDKPAPAEEAPATKP